MKIIQLLAIFFFDVIDKILHQRRILKELKKHISEIDLFIDIGAHKGSYTDLILKNFNTKNVFMFEPQKKIFKFTKNKYKKSKNIKIFNNAVSNTNKTKKIFINKHDLTSSLNELNKKNIYLNFKAKIFGSNISNMIHEMYHVKTEKLSTIIKKNKFKKIDLLKIDTEGHEFEVLKGLENKIKIVKNILIEFHNDNVYLRYNSNKIHRHLIKNDFVLQRVIKFPFTTWEDRIYTKKQN